MSAQSRRSFSSSSSLLRCMTAVALAAQALAASAAATPETPSATSGASAALEIAPPFSQVLYGSRDERDLLRRALEIAVRDCMASRGFEYTPRDPKSVPESPNAYGFVTPAQAKAHGYAPPPAAKPAAARGAKEKAATPEWEIALRGDPEKQKPVAEMLGYVVKIDKSSCLFRARAATYGASDWDQLVFALNDVATHVINDTIASPEFVAARERWKACMKSKGFDVGSELGSAQKLAGTGSKGGKRAAFERKVASADASCLVDSDLWAVARKNQASFEDQENQKDPARTERLRSLHQSAVQRARIVVARGRTDPGWISAQY